MERHHVPLQVKIAIFPQVGLDSFTSRGGYSVQYCTRIAAHLRTSYSIGVWQSTLLGRACWVVLGSTVLAADARRARHKRNMNCAS